MEQGNKNNYELKKQEREHVRKERRKKLQLKKTSKFFIRFALWAFIITAVGYGVFILAKTAGPSEEDFSLSYDIQVREHIAVGASHPPYNSNPPSSGWHYGSTAQGGFYDEPLPDEQVIHNLEHGDIWIAYHPDIEDKFKETLKSFAGRYVVVSPRSENEGDISLVAWGRVDTFDIKNDILDEGRIKDFIKRYDNRGPERVRGVQTGHGGF